MEVSSEAADGSSLPCKTETLEPESFVPPPPNPDAFLVVAEIEARDGEVLENPCGLALKSEITADSHKALDESRSSDKRLSPQPSNHDWTTLISTSGPQTEENLGGSLPSSPQGSPISVPTKFETREYESMEESGKESDECLFPNCDNKENSVIDANNDAKVPHSPVRMEPEEGASTRSGFKLIDGEDNHDNEGSGDDFERCSGFCEGDMRYYMYPPMGCNNSKFYGYHPPFSRRRMYDGRWQKQLELGSWHRDWQDRYKWHHWTENAEKSEDREEKPPSGPTGVGAGLRNLGNTCFMNAILQCFTHTVPLVNALRSCNHVMPCSNEGFCILCVLRDHIELSLSSSGKIVEPLKLVENLNNISSFFRPCQQEDAHEFLQCLLDRLERCCLDSSPNDDSLPSQDKNIVERVFGGRLVSKLRCCNCDHCSYKYEPLIDLSLEIEDVDTLQSALESFTMVEKIEDSETKFTCENCTREVSREKQLMLDQAPSVAALHLKRFKTDGTSVEKISKHVQFPLELDLKPYTNDNERNNNVSFKYQLYAVVVHSGWSPASGHYCCYIRSSPDTWHELDDKKVFKKEEELVLSENAYILFYAREGTPWCSSLIEPQELCLDPTSSNTSPKSVLDNVDSACTSYPSALNMDSSEAKETEDAIEGTSSHICCQRKLEDVEISEARDETEGISAQISNSNGPKFHRAVFDSPMVDVSLPLGSSDCHDGVLHDDMLCAPPSVEEDSCNQVGKTIGRNGDLHPPTPPRSPKADICSRGLPEGRHRIPRDHLKVENRVNCKKPSQKGTKDLQRTEALRYLRTVPSSRSMVLRAAMQPRNDKKRPRSSPCKRPSPPDSRRRRMRIEQF